MNGEHEKSARNVVRTIHDLERIARSRPAMYPRSGFRLELTGLGDVDQAMWESRLNRYYSMCGCKSSGWFMALAFIGYVGLILLVPSVASTGWSRFAWGLLVVLAAALAGKLTGLAIGALLFRHHVGSLHASLAAVGHGDERHSQKPSK